MRAVSVIGVGCTAFGKLAGVGIKEMAADACAEALADAGLPPARIQALYLGNFSDMLARQGALAPMVANMLGMQGIPCTKVEGACASAGIAFRHGLLLVATGQCDLVLVAGVEKMTEATTEQVTEALATAGDMATEMRSGLTFPGAFGIIMRRHMHEYGTTRAQIGMVSVKNRANSVPNPKSQFREAVSLEKVVGSRLVCDPIRLFDCCPISDGAAAAVLCPAEMAAEFSHRPVDVIGSGHAMGPGTLYQMRDITTFDATTTAGRQAYAQAGLGPGDVDVAEGHDCFTMAEIMATEDLGFFPKGKGGPAVEDGLTRVGGRIAVNPSGGLLSKGHPVGATGMAQVYEVTQQLRGEAANQVRGAEVGLAHNLGGTGVVSTVHLLRRRAA